MTKLQALKLLLAWLRRGYILPPTDAADIEALGPVIAASGLGNRPSITGEMVDTLIRAEQANALLLGAKPSYGVSFKR